MDKRHAEKHYAEDLAYIADVGFGGFATGAAPGLFEMLRQRGITEGRVVDLGCGNGIWAAELVRAGYDVTGIDCSPAMLAIARKRAPSATFRRGSYLDVELPPCHAVTSMGEPLSYRFDKKVGEKSLFRLFRRVHQALHPGGVFIFDVRQTQRSADTTAARLRKGLYNPTASPAGCWEGKDWINLVRIEKPNARELTRYITTFRKVGKLYRRHEEVHRLWLYDASALAAELRRIGFRVRRLRGYGKLRFKAGHVGFLAAKT